MEEWKTGMLEYWGKEQKINHLNCNNSFKPIIPLFHHSNLGEASKFYYVVMINKADLKFGEIMMSGGHISRCII